jgi:hypothetical protein
LYFVKNAISGEAWNATSAEFKNIWKICNGQNGTPDLRGGWVGKYFPSSTTLQIYLQVYFIMI